MNTTVTTTTIGGSSHSGGYTFFGDIDGTHGLTYTVQASNDLRNRVTLGTTETGCVSLFAEDRLDTATFETDATTTDEPTQFSQVMVVSP